MDLALVLELGQFPPDHPFTYLPLGNIRDVMGAHQPAVRTEHRAHDPLLMAHQNDGLPVPVGAPHTGRAVVRGGDYSGSVRTEVRTHDRAEVPL